MFLSLWQRVWCEADACLRAPRPNAGIRLIDPLPQHSKGAKEKGNDGLHPLRPRRTTQPRVLISSVSDLQLNYASPGLEVSDLKIDSNCWQEAKLSWIPVGFTCRIHGFDLYTAI